MILISYAARVFIFYNILFLEIVDMKKYNEVGFMLPGQLHAYWLLQEDLIYKW